MIFARFLFLIGSVLALFGVWRFISPYIYDNVVANPKQGLVFLITGGVMLWIGRQLERRNNGGA